MFELFPSALPVTPYEQRMSNARNAATFAQGGAGYRAARPTYPPALFDWLAAIAPANTMAWDIGCGSGQATVDVAARFVRVIANDPAPDALMHAPQLPNVTWVCATAESCELPSEAVDLALAASSFHWLDHDKFFPVLERALRPGAVFAAVAYGRTAMAPELQQAATVAFAPLQPYWAEGNRAVWSGYRDLPFPLTPVSAPSFAIEVDWTLDRYLAYAATWSACARHAEEVTAAGGSDAMAYARRVLEPVWGDAMHRITMPLTLRVGLRHV